MASKILLLALNLIFFSLFTSTYACPPRPVHKHKSPPTLPPNPITPPSPNPKAPPTPPKVSTPPPVSTPPKAPTPPTVVTPPKAPTPPKAATPPPKGPTPPTGATPPTSATCPRDALKLGACGNVLGGLIGLVVGTPSKDSCCGLLNGLADIDAAVCLCTAIKANVLGINLNVPVDLSLLLNYCDKKVPNGFKCV